jgi:hypothetical protein
LLLRGLGKLPRFGNRGVGFSERFDRIVMLPLGDAAGVVDNPNGIRVLNISGDYKGEGGKSQNYSEGSGYPVSGEKSSYSNP